MKIIKLARTAGDAAGAAACRTSESGPIAAPLARRRSERAHRKAVGERRRRLAATTLATLLALATLSRDAGAALQAVGPIDPATTLPAWYSDPAGRALEPCLDQNGFCILPPLFDPAVTVPPAAITASGPIGDLNFPDESFYFIADSLMNVGPAGTGRARLRLALEAAFLGGVSPSTGIVFARVNLARIPDGLTPNSTYTVTHPYGSFTFTSDAAGASLPSGISPTAAYRTEDPVAPTPGLYLPPDLAGATTTHLGPFLTAATGPITDPASGHTYVGDPRVLTTVTGSPNGNNFFRIDGPNIGGFGIDTVQTPLFTVAGRVFQGTIASPLTIDRATYSRDGVNTALYVSATALPNAVLTLSGSGLPTTTLTQAVPGSGNFAAHIVVPGTTLPTSLVLSNSLDTPAPVPRPVTLSDSVVVARSFYDPAASRLNVVADSLDDVAPPVLSLTGYPTPNTLDASGAISLPLPAAPLKVTVGSSQGGAVTVPVSIFTPAPAPVAVGDAATTPPDVAVVIPVLANDTVVAPGLINPGTVAISTPPLSGYAVPAADGTVTYIPPAGFTGATSFAYTVSNTQGAASGPATVNVSVAAPAPAPVAVNDTASTPAGTAVSIPVLANDTIAAPGVIDPASVAISTPPLNGTALPNPNGSITFTPAAGFSGSASFAYTVSNTAGTASNAATATVNVTAAAPASVIAIRLADFVRSTGSLRAEGTITPAGVKTLTLAFANAAGTILATAGTTSSDTGGRWVFNRSGLVLPLGATTLKVTAPDGSTRSAPLAIK